MSKHIIIFVLSLLFLFLITPPPAAFLQTLRKGGLGGNSAAFAAAGIHQSKISFGNFAHQKLFSKKVRARFSIFDQLKLCKF